MKIEIKDIGIFEIKKNYLHRGINPRLVTYDKGVYKSVQFDNYKDDLHLYENHNQFQKGYDFNGNEIMIKILI